MAARMAKQAGSLAKSCDGDQAALLGSYRLMRNDGQAGGGSFTRAAELAKSSGLLLAVEDTTSVSYPHAAAGLGLTQAGGQAERLHGAFGAVAGCPERMHSGPDSPAPLVP